MDEPEELESGGLAASDPFHPDHVNLRFLPADLNAYQHHFDVPMFKYVSSIETDFQAAHRRNVHCRDQVFHAVNVHTASILVTAEAVHFALQNALADGQYVHQHSVELKPVRTPVAIFGSLGVCIYVPASRHWLISYSPIHLT